MESDPFDDDDITDNTEIMRLEEEFYEYVNIKQDDDMNESLLTSTPTEADKQPDILQQLQSVCLMKWKEDDGIAYEGTGFLAKIKIGSELRIGFHTAGHNILQKNKQLVNFKSMKLKFKHIGSYTKTTTLAELLSKLKSHVIACAANKTLIFIKENGQKEEKACKAGLDFCSILFTGPVEKIAKVITKMGFNYLEIGEKGTCGPAPDAVVTLIGFPQFVETKKMRILPGKELPVTLGNLPDNIYTIETAPGASGGPINKKNGEVKAIHIRGKKEKNGDLGNKGLSFDSIRDELLEYFNCVSSDVSSDPFVVQGKPPLFKFLEKLKLDNYSPKFEEESIDFEGLLECDKVELKELFEAIDVKFGHQMIIKKALEKEKKYSKRTRNMSNDDESEDDLQPSQKEIRVMSAVEEGKKKPVKMKDMVPRAGAQSLQILAAVQPTVEPTKLVYVNYAKTWIDNSPTLKYALDAVVSEGWTPLFQFLGFKSPVNGSVALHVGVSDDWRFKVQREKWIPSDGWTEKPQLQLHVLKDPREGMKMYTVSHAQDGRSRILDGLCEVQTNTEEWTDEFIFWAKEVPKESAECSKRTRNTSNNGKKKPAKIKDMVSRAGAQSLQIPTAVQPTVEPTKLVYVNYAQTWIDNSPTLKYALDAVVSDGWTPLLKFLGFKSPVNGSVALHVGVSDDWRFKVQREKWIPSDGWTEKPQLQLHVLKDPIEGMKMYTVSHAQDGRSRILDGLCEVQTNMEEWTDEFSFWAKEVPK